MNELLEKYLEAVQSIATDALECNGPDTTDDDAERFAQELVDGSEWTLYDYNHGIVMAATSNHLAIERVYIDGCATLREMAYYAFLADVEDAMEDIRRERSHERD